MAPIKLQSRLKHVTPQSGGVLSITAPIMLSGERQKQIGIIIIVLNLGSNPEAIDLALQIFIGLFVPPRLKTVVGSP